MATTRFYDFLNMLLSDDEKKAMVPALRQDTLIFSGLQSSVAVDNLEKAQQVLKENLFPAAFALSAVHPELFERVAKGERLPVDVLEQSLATYENLKQGMLPEGNLSTAVDLALALIEKRKVVSHWKLVLNDVFKSRSANTSQDTAILWKAALLIASQLDTHKEEIFEILSQPGVSNAQQAVFVHCVLAQPVVAESKIHQMAAAFANHGEAEQVRELDLIAVQAGKKTAAAVAREIISSMTSLQPGEVQTAEVWSAPVQYLNQAEKLQKLGLIHQIAGDDAGALKHVEAANEIIAMFKAGLEVQRLGSLRAADQKDQRVASALELLQQNAGDEDVLTEVMLAIEPGEDAAVVSAVNEAGNSAVDLARAKSIDAAGNTALAREAEAQAFSSFPSNSTFTQPRFSRHYSLEYELDSLDRLALLPEAARVAQKLLEQNPSDLDLVQKSAGVFFKNGNYPEALSLYQSLELLSPSSLELKRSKAHIFDQLGENAQAFDAWKTLIGLEEPKADADLLHLALSANRMGDSTAAIEAASGISEESPIYAKALIALGRAYRNIGDNHEAITHFAKAIETEVEDEEPWLALSELYFESGEMERSIDTLKAARSVFPKSKEIPFELAKQLLSKNSPSEALNVLDELTEKEPEYLPAQVLAVKTMKALNLPGLDTRIDELSNRFPNSPEIMAFKGQRYLNEGYKVEARNLLSKAVSSGSPEPEWLVAYADSLAGENYNAVQCQNEASEKEIAEARQALEKSGVLEHDPLAVAIQAEMLLQAGDAAGAFNAISDLQAKQVTSNSDGYWRLQAGLARASTILGKFDIALAAIQDAINQKPGMTGLHQILAEVYKASGDMQSALEAANQVLLIGPEVVQNVLWFVQFLSGLGKKQEAEQELQKALTRKPDEIKYRLALADMLSQSDRESELRQMLGSVETLSKTAVDEADMVAAAHLYLKVDDRASVAKLLAERAARYPQSIQAKLDLAGTLAMDHKMDQALAVLDQASSGREDKIMKLIRAQVHYDASGFEKAREELDTLNSDLTLEGCGLLSEFIPETWSTLFEQPAPSELLKARDDFALGNFELAAGSSNGKLNKAAKSPWMQFLREQSRLALGNDVEVSSDSRAELPGVVAYTRAQAFIDKGETGAALKLTDAIICGKDQAWQDALRSQIAAARGELIEAQVAGNATLSTGDSAKWVKVEEIAKVRSLILAALARWQWNEAFTLAETLYSSNTGNISNAGLYLKVMVSMLENAQEVQGLDIKMHAPSEKNLEQANTALVELCSSLDGSHSTEINHWVLRGKLVQGPNAANVRALALLTPQIGDITAMMGALHILGDDATAIQLARKFESAPRVLAMMARCLESSDRSQSLASLTRSLQIVEAQPDVWVFRSRLEEQLGEKENSIQSMENALSYWPEESGWQIRTAKLWQSAGDVKKAVAHIKTAADQEDQNIDLQYQIGSAYLSLGSYDDAIRTLEAASAKELNRADILEALADAYYHAKNIEKALKSASQASSVDPFTIKPLLLTGEIALEKGELSKALDIAHQAIARNEKSPDAITFLAKVLIRKGDKVQALAALEKASSSEEATLDLMLKHAHLVREIKGAADSRTIFEGLVKKYPQNIELLKLLAESQWECGDKNAAEGTIRHSLHIDPEQPDLHGFLGIVKSEAGNLDQAVEHFSAQISLDHEQVDGYLNLAKVYQHQREFHKALDTLQQAINVAPQDTRAFLAAAGMLKEAKDYASAEVMLRKAATLAPNDVTIKRQLGAVIALNLVHKSQQESAQL
jgi:tetratricopeptide (TPR) repeat protein